MQSIVGIDPGLTGAIAVLGDDNTLVCHNMPFFEFAKSGGKGTSRRVDDLTLIRILRSANARQAMIEDVHSMPGMGAPAVFTFGMAFGMAISALGAIEIPRMFIAPVIWKRYFKLSKDKKLSIRRASEIFPMHSAQFQQVYGQINAEQAGGRAEAALLAIYCRWKLEGKIP